MGCLVLADSLLLLVLLLPPLVLLRPLVRAVASLVEFLALAAVGLVVAALHLDWFGARGDGVVLVG